MTRHRRTADSTTPESFAESIGLIGLGLMGGAMARRLTAQGYVLWGADISESARSQFDAIGPSTHAGSVNEVAEHCRRVVLSLPTHREAESVIHSLQGVLQAGHVIIDTTTGAPSFAERASRDLEIRGIQYFDATVSGSSSQLENGEATWMIGGDPDAFRYCEALFHALGQDVFHVGPAGSGSRMKLVTNLVLGLNRAALAEGLTFAESIGLDLATALRVLQQSPAYSRMMDTKGQKMLQSDFSPQARLSQHLKDVQLMEDLAATAGISLRLTDTHRKILQRAVELGLGDLDNSALIEVMRKDLEIE